jgi:hypothetical protein
VVTTSYKPVLADAVKIRRNPDLEDKTPFKAPLNYVTIDKRLEKDNEIRQLDAMKMPAEHDSVMFNNYVKGGVGNVKTTYAEAYFGNGKDNALQVNGYLKHFAQQGGLPKQNQSREQVGVFGKTINEENSLSGRIDYDYRSNYFYGYNVNAQQPPAVEPAKQHFSTIGGEGELVKNYRDTTNDFTYALKLKGYLFSDAYQARENNIVLSGFINQTVNQFRAGLSGSVDVATQKDSLYSYNNSLLRLNPYLRFQGNNYKVDAGINVVKEFGYFSSFYIFPAAKFELQVLPKYLRMFVEATGDVNRSSLHDFSLINPYMAPNIAIKNSVDQLDIAAGLKGTLAPGLGFKATIFRNSIKDMPLFVSNYIPGPNYNTFSVIYDNGKSRVNGFIGELDYKASEDFDLFGKVEFKNYNLASEAQAWNLPKFNLTAGTMIHINSKVGIHASMLLRGDTYDRINASTGTTVSYSQIRINSFVDISGGVDYKITNRLNIFGNVNNLLSGTNERWLYYPGYGFNIFGGVGYAF